MKNSAQNILLKILSADQIFFSCLYTTIRTDRQQHFNIRNILHESKNNVKHKQVMQKQYEKFKKVYKSQRRSEKE